MRKIIKLICKKGKAKPLFENEKQSLNHDEILSRKILGVFVLFEGSVIAGNIMYLLYLHFS